MEAAPLSPPRALAFLCWRGVPISCPYIPPASLVIRSLPCCPLRTSTTVVSFCGKARFPPKDPTVGPVECRMVISPRFAFPRSVIPTP